MDTKEAIQRLKNIQNVCGIKLKHTKRLTNTIYQQEWSALAMAIQALEAKQANEEIKQALEKMSKLPVDKPSD